MPVYQLDTNDYWFPPISEAVTDPAGLLAIGGDLSVPRLLQAYQQGIFPWFSAPEPILWWAPSPRMVLKPEQLHVSKSMRKWMRKTPLTITFDHAFERVIDACGGTIRAGQTQAESWITPTMKQAYTNLFRSGYAHSVEVWQGHVLVGGLYGIALGRMFFGESMFSHADNASKFAFICLSKQLQSWGFTLIDCQMHTNHLSSLGAVEIEIAEFQAYLDHNQSYGVDSAWELVIE